MFTFAGGVCFIVGFLFGIAIMAFCRMAKIHDLEEDLEEAREELSSLEFQMEELERIHDKA